MLNSANIDTWSCEQVSQWLRTERLERLVEPFIEQDIDGETLLLLTASDVKEHFTETKLGERKKLLHKIDLLRAKHNHFTQNSPNTSSSILNPPGPHAQQFMSHLDGHRWEMGDGASNDPLCNQYLPQCFESRDVLEANYRHSDHDSRPTSQHPSGNATPRSDPSPRYRDRDLDELEIQLSGYAEEGIKTLVAILYCFTCFLVTAYVMVCSAERAPDLAKYPPLPDIVLDSLPYMPWAFALAEYCVFVEITLVGIILLFHRYRQIVLRRGLAIAGSLFLLRSLTMFVTSLSVPNRHTECTIMRDAYEGGEANFRQRLKIALDIGLGFGLSTMGVQTCGDYMFSGHTAILTLLNHLITEYGPKWAWLQAGAWLLNAFGAFFVLASHEHYTLDVVVALYITSRMFIYYHQLASTGPSRWRGRKGQHVKYSNFPLFWFFEGNIPGPVPNLYENPIQAMRRTWRRIVNHGAKDVKKQR